MKSDETICARELRAVAGALREWLDVDALADRVGLPAPIEDVSDEDASDVHIGNLWRAAMMEVADPTLPLAVGESIPFGTYDVIDYLASACSTVGMGLRKVGRYFAIITPNITWEVDDAPSPAVRLIGHHGGLDERIVYIQYTLGVTFGRFKRLADGPFAFERVELPIPEPPDTARHEAFFGCPIRYGVESTSIRFPRRVWDLSLQRQDSGLASILERHARERLESLETTADPMTPIRVAVREQLPDGPPKLDAVAKSVAMSGRTLQRRLREAGTSFQVLVDEERRSAARAYLGDRHLAVAEIAYLLGYSEASAFVRAFKRWTGMTPKQFRNAAA